MSAVAGSTGRLPLVVGVSGHRAIRPGDEPALEAAVGAIFDGLRAACPATPLVLLSPCAEGADQLVARVGRGKGASLIVMLPMARDLYERDFRGAARAAFEEFLAQPGVRTLEVPLLPGSTPDSVAAASSDDRKLQYLRMGTFLARNCHVLIALWNGKPSSEPGGTAQIVAFKRTGRIDLPPRLEARIEADEEPFRTRRNPLDHAECGVIHHVLTPNGENDAVDGSVGEHRLLRPDGLSEEGAAAAFDARNDEIQRRVEDFNVALERWGASAPAEIGGLDLPPDLLALRDFFARTDRLAARLSRLTSNTLVLLCGTAFLAAAAFEVFAHLSDGRERLRTGALCAHLLFLVLAGVFWGVARRLRLEDRFQDTRAVAEGLRVQFFWRLAGLPNAAADHYLRKQRSDLDWIRNAVRYFGLTTAPCSPPRLSRVFDDWVEREIVYYRARGEAHRRSHEALRRGARLALSASVGTAGLWGCAAAARRLFGVEQLESFVSGRTFDVFVFFVALAAVLGGLLHYANERRAHGALARQYDRILSFFLAARANLAGPEPVEAPATLLELGKEALAENGDWVLLRRERPLQVPHAA